MTWARVDDRGCEMEIGDWLSLQSEYLQSDADTSLNPGLYAEAISGCGPSHLQSWCFILHVACCMLQRAPATCNMQVQCELRSHKLLATKVASLEYVHNRLALTSISSKFVA